MPYPIKVIPVYRIVQGFARRYFCVLKKLKTNKMKTTFLAMLFIALVTFASCKKDDPTPAPAPAAVPSLVGFWAGKYGSGATTYPTAGYAFLYRADGTVRVYNATDTASALKAEGTYVITGNSVTSTYAYLPALTAKYSTTAIVDAKFTFTEGTWGSGTNTSNGGNYFLNKK